MPDFHPAAEELEAEVLAFIDEGLDAVGEPPDDSRFEALARAVFRYQYERNAPYRSWCRSQGKTPETVTSWREIPAVPTDAFKEIPLACFPAEAAERVYVTSGTTRGGRNGRHYIRSLRLYHASLRPNFHAHVLPDLPPEGRIRMLLLFPGRELLRNSSLGDMLEEVRRLWGTPESGTYIDAGGLRLDALQSALADAVRRDEPVALLGAAFSFVHLLDHLAASDQRFRLPPGSRIMDTGGFKGRSREVDREELLHLYEDRLGIPAVQVVNEYGMTELGSQFYDSVLRETAAGRADAAAHRRKLPPPWARTTVVDPETLAPVPPGTVGCLRHVDLSNLHSVMAIQTDDLGVQREDGFEVLGRAWALKPAGRSLAVEDLLQAARPGRGERGEDL